MISQERLHYLFDYDPEGYLIWKNHPRLKSRNGMRVGSVNGKGYLLVNLDGKSNRVHRLIWMYHYGSVPEKPYMIDHIDNNKLNNRIENLRVATSSQNLGNRPMLKKEGHKGIRYLKNRNKYKAEFQHNKTYYYLGLYKTFEEAVEVYRKKYTELVGEFARF